MGDLVNEFEKKLNNETERILLEIMKLYKKNVIVNMGFGDLVRSLVREDYKYYAVDISLRAYKLMPRGYTCDSNDKYALVTDYDAAIDHITKYTKYCIQENRSNPIIAAQHLMEILINIEDKKLISDISFLEIVANNMNVLFPEHHDSIDSRAMVYYLQFEMEKRGYVVTSFEPFKMIKKNTIENVY